MEKSTIKTQEKWYIRMVVKANGNMAALKLKIMENEETTNKFINDNLIWVMAEIGRLNALFEGLSCGSVVNLEEVVRSTMLGVEGLQDRTNEISKQEGNLVDTLQAKPRAPTRT